MAAGKLVLVPSDQCFEGSLVESLSCGEVEGEDGDCGRWGRCVRGVIWVWDTGEVDFWRAGERIGEVDATCRS